MRLPLLVAATVVLAAGESTAWAHSSPSGMTGQPIPGANQDNYRDTRSTKRRAADEAREKARSDKAAAEAARKAAKAEPRRNGQAER